MLNPGSFQEGNNTDLPPFISRDKPKNVGMPRLVQSQLLEVAGFKNSHSCRPTSHWFGIVARREGT